jgi:hypothetical protein
MTLYIRVNLRRSTPMMVSFPSGDRYFHQLYACLPFASYPIIFSCSNNYLRRSDKYLETVSKIAVIFNFEQVLDRELILLQVLDSEKLKSVFSCFDNVIVGSHDLLYRRYNIFAEVIHLLLCLLIPKYQLIIFEPNQVE